MYAAETPISGGFVKNSPVTHLEVNRTAAVVQCLRHHIIPLQETNIVSSHPFTCCNIYIYIYWPAVFKCTHTSTHKRTQAHAQEHVRMYVLTIETPAINHEIKEEIKKLNLITYNFGRSAIWIAVIISQHVNTPLCVRVRIDGLVSKRRRPTLTGFITSRGI